MLYVITYDLRTQGRDYSSLYKTIRDIGPALNCLRSVWFVQSMLPILNIRELLLRQMTSQDSLIVVDITGKIYDGWLKREYWDWIRAHNF